jgi:hypothetical protein
MDCILDAQLPSPGEHEHVGSGSGTSALLLPQKKEIFQREISEKREENLNER